MAQFTIVDVRPTPGDGGFLIDDGITSILYDTGFAFTGHELAANIKKVLGDRKLDYIFLSHSHYDHALGTPYVLRVYPEAKVVAGAYAKKIFDKPTARAKMRDLDGTIARQNGIMEYEDLIDELRVDISVNDGDVLRCGDMTVRVIDLPGHTHCSVGFFLEEHKLLLGTETLGGYFGKDTYCPSFLVSYEKTLESFDRAASLEPEHVMIPHYGVVGGEKVKSYLKDSKAATVATAEKVLEIFKNGGTEEDARAYFKDVVYNKTIERVYPFDAFMLNSGIMIKQIQKELM